MSERAPYSRVYWAINRDPKFVGIYGDDPALALWLRLLITADALWPASAPLPRSARKRPLDALVTAGLVDLEPDDFYRIHGLDEERGRRASAASASASARWSQSEPDANASQSHPERNASRDETRRDTPSRDEPDGREDLEAFLLVTRRAPTPRQRALLDGVLDRHDLTGAKWAADIILRNPNDPIGAVIEADKAWRAERIAEATAAEKPKPQARRCRGLPQSARDILAEMQKIEAEKGAA
jgi:hypothetical protein